MEDLQIAYYLIVIMVGFAVLAIAGFWTFKTQDADLRNFWILYALFTLVLIVSVLRKYLFLNVEDYSARAWYVLSGTDEILSFAVLVALIHFFAGVYQVRYRKAITITFLVMMLVCIVLILSPIGAVLDASARSIRFEVGFRIAAVWYFTSFTFAMALGYGLLHRLWHTERRNFVIGLLIFASVGYSEAIISLIPSLRNTGVTPSNGNDFLFSSIPYALYGVFLIVYFLRYPIPVPLELDDLPDAFLTRYGITDREREIILKVMQGKSNSEIAGELFITLGTVKTHLHNVYRKLEVDSRYDLLAKVRSGQ